ncbi:ABC transporter substrate-binding protein [Jatrophihabitans lederbergiae]|uniref:ABC transporter substrate-binding protein n=1 Tax=Jatrophihabitans lederbergiae TaxID=3075547 RepID=A0ABU2JCH1_9ACTN|nr:ABC transporter substrate-binding protein [Jatrophihabitans sp. DSM 44399]MDT0262642.1 ABC transporter substrate-binding protein [Jatrophihabitans sp. DSM 44399]
MRFTRKSASTTALALLLATAVSACSGGSGSGSGAGGAAKGAVDKQAKVTLGWAEPVDTLNPATTGNRDVGPIDANIFDTLVWLTPDFKVTPDLATKWTVSPDAKTYTFTLREDVKFHDGTAFDAAAVVSNINYMTNKSTQSNISLGLLGPCTKATATAKYTVKIECTAGYAPLLAQLGEPYMGMQSPAAIQKYGKDLGLHPVGTGAFEFVSYQPNQSVVLKRNEAYNWAPAAVKHTGPPDIAQLTFQIVPSSQARVTQFQSGQSDFMQETPGIFWNTLGKTGRYTSIQFPITGMGIFAPINAGSFPTNDPAVRKAIMYAVDKAGAIKVADAGVFAPSNTPLQKGMVGYDSSLEGMYSYDPAKAESTLQAAGWTKNNGIYEKGGKRLTLNITAIASVPEYPLIAQAIQGYLRKVGMDAKVSQQAVPAWLASNIKGNMSLTPLQYIAVDPDALHLWFLPGQYFNWSHYTNPTLTSLINQGQKETDPAKRQTIYSQAQKIIMEQAVLMPIHENVDLVMTSKKLTGLTYSGGGFEYFGAASMTK